MKTVQVHLIIWTTLDEWIYTFETYMCVILSIFPTHAIELIGNMGSIRETVADFPGLGFVIYN